MTCETCTQWHAILHPDGTPAGWGECSVRLPDTMADQRVGVITRRTYHCDEYTPHDPPP